MKIHIITNLDGGCIYGCCDDLMAAYVLKNRYPNSSELKVVTLEVNNTETVFIPI